MAQQKEVMEHLHEALAVESSTEKNYHIRQALQHLDIENE